MASRRRTAPKHRRAKKKTRRGTRGGRGGARPDRSGGERERRAPRPKRPATRRIHVPDRISASSRGREPPERGCGARAGGGRRGAEAEEEDRAAARAAGARPEDRRNDHGRHRADATTERDRRLGGRLSYTSPASRAPARVFHAMAYAIITRREAVPRAGGRAAPRRPARSDEGKTFHPMVLLFGDDEKTEFSPKACRDREGRRPRARATRSGSASTSADRLQAAHRLPRIAVGARRSRRSAARRRRREGRDAGEARSRGNEAAPRRRPRASASPGCRRTTRT